MLYPSGCIPLLYMLHCPMPLKSCARCGDAQPLENFSPDHTPYRKDGLCPYCKTCKTELTQQWKLNNPKKVKAQATRWRVKHG